MRLKFSPNFEPSWDNYWPSGSVNPAQTKSFLSIPLSLPIHELQSKKYTFLVSLSSTKIALTNHADFSPLLSWVIWRDLKSPRWRTFRKVNVSNWSRQNFEWYVSEVSGWSSCDRPCSPTRTRVTCACVPASLTSPVWTTTRYEVAETQGDGRGIGIWQDNLSKIQGREAREGMEGRDRRDGGTTP